MRREGRDGGQIVTDKIRKEVRKEEGKVEGRQGGSGGGRKELVEEIHKARIDG